MGLRAVYWLSMSRGGCNQHEAHSVRVMGGPCQIHYQAIYMLQDEWKNLHNHLEFKTLLTLQPDALVVHRVKVKPMQKCPLFKGMEIEETCDRRSEAGYSQPHPPVSSEPQYSIPVAPVHHRFQSGLWSHVSLMRMTISNGHFCTSITFTLRTTWGSGRNIGKVSKFKLVIEFFSFLSCRIQLRSSPLLQAQGYNNVQCWKILL